MGRYKRDRRQENRGRSDGDVKVTNNRSKNSGGGVIVRDDVERLNKKSDDSFTLSSVYKEEKIFSKK